MAKAETPHGGISRPFLVNPTQTEVISVAVGRVFRYVTQTAMGSIPGLVQEHGRHAGPKAWAARSLSWA